MTLLTRARRGRDEQAATLVVLGVTTRISACPNQKLSRPTGIEGVIEYLRLDEMGSDALLCDKGSGIR